MTAWPPPVGAQPPADHGSAAAVGSEKQPRASAVLQVPPEGMTLVLRGLASVAAGGLPVLPSAVPTFSGGAKTGAGNAVAGAPAPAVGSAGVMSSQNASGLPWRSGVFGHSLERTERFQQVMQRKVDVIGVAPSRGSWASIMDGWWLERAPEGFVGTLDVAVPLWQEDGDLASAAAGEDEQHWEELGRVLHERYPGSTVRIGWEFNLAAWSHHADEANVEQWKSAFRHASIALKRGGPSLLVTWNPNKGRGDSLPEATLAWPGDDVVDIVGLDAYDWWPAYSESTWPQHRDSDQGWAFWVNFARSRGKAFAVPEWGVAPGNDHGGGDNPYYVQTVVDYLAGEHRKDGIVHSVLYFDEPESYIANSMAEGQVPQSAAAYREALNHLAAPGAGAEPGEPGRGGTQQGADAQGGSGQGAERQGGTQQRASQPDADKQGRPWPDQDAASEAGPGHEWSAPHGQEHGPVPG
ncbi:glycoside hydrolase family 26 protein [Gephyromycinifex aptenodytis]|uniref:hypothetical protein n=1 Tax=Gephyromycinifex aptenodytis TaxID=2716227 RepID=UPI0014477A1C|nr:hypothetical protein [Gephyromycinifex aptenodytis]